MGIEKSVIDGDVERKGLYSESELNELQEKIDTIIYQIDGLNMQLEFCELAEKQAELMAEKQILEEEKQKIEQKLKEIKNAIEPEELESADSFAGILNQDGEELFSARDIGKAYVPNVPTLDKKKAREVDDEYIKNDDELSQSAQEINDGFKGQANKMSAMLDDLFR